MNPKTPEQLKREITYYADQIQRTTSRDRIDRAHRAIRVRERQLAAALRVQGVPRGTVRQLSETRGGD